MRTILGEDLTTNQIERKNHGASILLSPVMTDRTGKAVPVQSFPVTTSNNDNDGFGGGPDWSQVLDDQSSSAVEVGDENDA